jgi:hypothetical protein
VVAIPIFGVLAGLVLGLGRYRVFALLPVILLVTIAAVAKGIASGLDPRTIALGTLLALASPQIGYLITIVASCFVVAHIRIRAAKRKPELLRAMQSGIGQELSAEFEPPREIPEEMVALIARMEVTSGPRSSIALPTMPK